MRRIQNPKSMRDVRSRPWVGGVPLGSCSSLPDSSPSGFLLLGSGFWILGSLFLAGCGYQVGGLLEHPKVKLSVFDNTTERRTHEIDLTGAVGREMAGSGIALNPSDAPVELVGKITDFREPALVETGQDEVLVGSVSIRLEISLLRRSDGHLLWTDGRTESASFATQRLESRETARQEVFDRLARWVVTKLEKDW